MPRTKLGNVYPDLPSTYSRDRRKCHAVTRCQNDERFVTITNGSHAGGGQLCFRVALASIVWNAHATLARGITHVVRLRSVEKMTRANTGSVVTVVARKGVRPAPVFHEEGNAIRPGSSWHAAKNDLHERPAGVIEVRTCPEPASPDAMAHDRTAALVDLRPKTFRESVLAKVTWPNATPILTQEQKKDRPSPMLKKKRYAMRLKGPTRLPVDRDAHASRTMPNNRTRRLVPEPASTKPRHDYRPAAVYVQPELVGERHIVAEASHDMVLHHAR